VKHVAMVRLFVLLFLSLLGSGSVTAVAELSQKPQKSQSAFINAGYRNWMGLGAGYTKSVEPHWGWQIEGTYSSNNVAESENLSLREFRHWTISPKLRVFPMAGTFHFDAGPMFSSLTNIVRRSERNSEYKLTGYTQKNEVTLQQIDLDFSLGNEWKLGEHLIFGAEWAGLARRILITRLDSRILDQQGTPKKVSARELRNEDEDSLKERTVIKPALLVIKLGYQF
jgi:hypothetical protein